MMQKIICSQHLLRKIPRTPKALSHINHLFVMIYNLRSIFFGEIWIQFDFISFDEIKISFLLESLTFPLWSFSSVDFQWSSLIFQEMKECGCQVTNHDFSWLINHELPPSLWLPHTPRIEGLRLSSSKSGIFTTYLCFCH